MIIDEPPDPPPGLFDWEDDGESERNNMIPSIHPFVGKNPSVLDTHWVRYGYGYVRIDFVIYGSPFPPFVHIN